ncbi:MAG: serine hydrolase [Aridibacter famidurans]|nr:serine hydrolase [Aridibacter famidurans]
MSIVRTFLVIAILPLWLATFLPSEVRSQGADGGRNLSAVDAEKLDSHIRNLREKFPTAPGMAVAIVKDDRIVFSKGYGYRNLDRGLPVNAQTQFYIASGTKVFTAATAKILAENGKIDLDVPISTYLPGLKLKAPLSEEQISLRDLLTHRGGLRSNGLGFRTSFSGQYDKDILIENLSKYGYATSPAYRYTNLGYIVTGLALEEATGKSWKDLAQSLIFEPIGMRNTSSYASKATASGNFALPYGYEDGGFVELPYKDDKTMHAAGGTVSSAEDLANWLIVMMNAGKYKGEQVFSPRVVRELISPQINQDRTFYTYRRYAAGLGWNLATYKGEEFIHSFGTFAGFRPHTSFMPEHKIGVVVLVNESVESFFLPDLVANEIYDYLLGKRDLSIEGNPAIDDYLRRTEQRRSDSNTSDSETGQPASIKQPSFPLSNYVGVYSNDEFGEIEITLRDNSLFAGIGSHSSKLTHLTGDSFAVDFLVLSPTTWTFESTEREGVTALIEGQDKFLKVAGR